MTTFNDMPTINANAVVAGNLGATNLSALVNVIAANDLFAGRDAFITGTLNASVKNFIEQHPFDPSLVIVYSVAEGPEATTFLRGRASLVNGQATIYLPAHFALVTAEQHLTVQLTPMGLCNGLAAVSVSTGMLQVRELLEGTSNVEFSYLVQGRRSRYPTWEAIRTWDALLDDQAEPALPPFVPGGMPSGGRGR